MRISYILQSLSHFSLYTFFMEKVKSKRSSSEILFVLRLRSLACWYCNGIIKNIVANDFCNYFVEEGSSVFARCNEHDLQDKLKAESRRGDKFQANRNPKQTSFVIKINIYCFFVF